MEACVVKREFGVETGLGVDVRDGTVEDWLESAMVTGKLNGA